MKIYKKLMKITAMGNIPIDKNITSRRVINSNQLKNITTIFSLNIQKRLSHPII